MSGSQNLSQAPTNFEVDLPGGGKLHLQTIDEVELWEDSSDRYLGDYKIVNQSDRLLVGAILTQHLTMFRAQQKLNGMEPELDPSGVPTGKYKKIQVSSQDETAAQTRIIKASQEIRELEKALGIDKKTRDAGGQYDVANYVGAVKWAAREYGLHLSKRYKRYEAFVTEFRTKLRMLNNLDSEDLAEMKLNPQAVLDWAYGELQALAEADQKFAHEKGKLIVGAVR